MLTNQNGVFFKVQAQYKIMCFLQVHFQYEIISIIITSV